MDEFSVTGGARIGLVNATWPFAKLIVSTTHLRLCSLIGTYEFLPRHVVSLERYGSIPFFSSGIRIAHARSDYPPKIIFWYLGNPETLIHRIGETGFSPTAPANSALKVREFPVRSIAILLSLLAWCGLFLLDRSFPRGTAFQPGLFALTALLLAFLVCWRTRTSPTIQKMILKDGHSVNEIKAFLLLVQIVVGILLAVFAVMLLTRAIQG